MPVVVATLRFARFPLLLEVSSVAVVWEERFFGFVVVEEEVGAEGGRGFVVEAEDVEEDSGFLWVVEDFEEGFFEFMVKPRGWG